MTFSRARPLVPLKKCIRGGGGSGWPYLHGALFQTDVDNIHGLLARDKLPYAVGGQHDKFVPGLFGESVGKERRTHTGWMAKRAGAEERQD